MMIGLGLLLLLSMLWEFLLCRGGNTPIWVWFLLTDDNSSRYNRAITTKDIIIKRKREMLNFVFLAFGIIVHVGILFASID